MHWSSFSFWKQIKHQRNNSCESDRNFSINHAKSIDEVPQEVHAVSAGCIFVQIQQGSSVRFIFSETYVLPQGSSGKGQFQDWTGGYAAEGISKHVYGQRGLCSDLFLIFAVVKH